MSSSDDEWRNPPQFHSKRTVVGYGGGEDALLAARRKKMQQQRREIAETVLKEGAAPSRQSVPQAVRVPDAPISKQQPKDVAVTEEMLESLRREVAAKKKRLAAATEKEAALKERWRAQKAQRLAEIAQLDANIRRQQDAMEDVKAAAERELHEAEDLQQRQLTEMRKKKEAEVRDMYEPQIATQRAILVELQQREAKLQTELNMGDTAKDLVNKCISSALATLLQRVEGIFAADTTEFKEWEAEVQRLVQHEVRSSFAVATDTEAQQMLEDYQRLFRDTLEFWRKAEEEEREHVLKMDERLLLDLQSMVHDDLDRLQREELGMEELYVQSREAWATQHQEMLRCELDAAMNRRTAEFEERRRMRHQLHLERMKVLEERQRDTLEKQRWFHEKHMALLREQHAKEEQLAELRSRVIVATQKDVSHAAEEFSRTMHHIENLLNRLKEYRTAVDDGRVVLQKERQRTLEDREATLSMLQDVVTKQTVSVMEEHNSLAVSLTKLETLRRAMEDHLESERVWLGKQEAMFAQGKAEWEREYRRWKQMVEDEKCRVQERFSGTLSELRNAAVQLAEEERETQADRESMKLWLRAVSEQAARELSQVQRREQDLKERQDTMHSLIEDMERNGAQVTQEWRKLQSDRQELQAEEDALREDELQLRQTSQCLRLLKAQLDSARIDDATKEENTRTLQHELRLSQIALQATQTQSTKTHRQPPPPSRRSAPVVSQNTNRLPLRVLSELRQILHGDRRRHRPGTAAELGDAAFAFDPPATNYGRSFDQRFSRQTPHEHQRQRQPHRQLHMDPSDISQDTPASLYNSSNNNFTSLITLSNVESPQHSFHTSA